MPDDQLYFSLYKDASDQAPYTPRWKAMCVSRPGEAIGQPVRDHRGAAVEWHSMSDAVRSLVADHGCRKGEIFRVYLRRYEGRDHFYPIPDFIYPDEA